MRRIFKIFAVVSIVTLTLMAAVAELSAQVGDSNEAVCVNALNSERTAWDQTSNFSKYVAEATRRGLTVDTCRQLIPPSTRNLPANPDSERSGWFILLIVALSLGLSGYFLWQLRQSTKYPSAIPNPAIVLEGDKYPDIARIIDVVAFLVLASGLFVPIARAGLRMMHLVDTDVALIFAGAAL